MIDYPGLRFGEARHDTTPQSWDERETLWRSRAWSVLTRVELRTLLDDRTMLVKAASDAQVEADVLRGGLRSWKRNGTRTSRNGRPREQRP